jgi:hypothetical protein
MARTSNVAAKFVVAGMLAAGTAVASAATAAADPPPPPPPGDQTNPVAPPPPGLNDALANPVTAILGDPAGPPGGAPVDLLLSQYQVPSVPGEQPQGLDINQAITGNAYLLPQNYANPTPGDGSPYGTAPGTITDRPDLISSLKGAHGLWHGAMGRLDPSQLGEPLPGTAPPPGTNIPQGLGDDLPNGPAPAPFPAPLALPPAG